MSKRFIGYAGTYTRESSKGIYRFVLDVEAGKLEAVDVAAEVGSPTYLAVSEDGRQLYAVAQAGKSGGVATFQIDEGTGDLSLVDEQVEEGAPPCHLDVRGQELVTGNYHKGIVKYIPVEADGKLDGEPHVYEQRGNGPHERQERPHVHFTGFSPDGRFVIVCDLGTDELLSFKVEAGKLEKVGTFTMKPGSGPRHIAFHPNGKNAYVINELSSEVTVFDYDAESGTFTDKQYIRAIPAEFSETNDASAIHVSKDGRFVYTGNRGHNSIAVFHVNEDNGQLTLVEIVPSGGDWPRDFVLDPSEAYLVASNQHSGNLVLFSRDQETGKLTKLDSEVSVPEVVCVKFLNVD